MTTKPGASLQRDRHLPDLLGEVDRRLERLLRGLVALDDLDQPHHGGGIEVVEADHLLGPQGGHAHLCDRQRGRVAGEDRVSGRARIQLGEHGLLDRHPLGDRLDHEVHVAEPVVLRGAGDPAHGLLELGLGLLCGQLLLLDQALELAVRDLAGLGEALVDELLVDVLQHHRQVRSGKRLGDLAAHRAGAHDRALENEHLSPHLRSPGTGTAPAPARKPTPFPSRDCMLGPGPVISANSGPRISLVGMSWRDR